MPVQCTCQTCGAIYSVKPHKASGSKFCSWPCKWKARGESLTIACATCGENFALRRSEYDHGTRSCSMACKVAAWTRSCDYCGQSYRAQRSLIKAGLSRYCSMACKNAALVIPFPDYVWAKIDQSAGPDACWPWTGARDKDGYGVTHIGKKHAKAHRVILEIKIGRPLTKGEMACHDCPNGDDHPWCCNPLHLWAGDAPRNAQDASKKGRTLRGSRNVNARFVDEEIRHIRAALAHPTRGIVAQLAREYRVSKSTIERIRNGQTWTHVSQPPTESPETVSPPQETQARLI